MKQLYKLSSITLAICLIVGSLSKTQAQDVSELLKSGPADATKLAQAYFSPAFKGFGFGMNSAWFNSAKAKNLGKFDLKIQATGAFVPTKDQTIRFSDLGLSNKVTPSAPTSPTFFGDENTNTTLDVKDNNGNSLGSIDMPGGTGLNTVPSPQIQLTVGLIKNTEVSVRFTPKVKGDDFGSVQTLGFGFKHEITKYLFPGKLEKVIPIDVALAFGFNQLKYNYNVKLNDQLNEKPSTQGQDLNQRVEAKFSGYTIDAILSKKLSVFTPFVSVGYNSAKTQLGILGSYIARTSAPTLANPLPDSDDKFTAFVDPVNINQTDISGLRANVGFSLHLAFFRLYGSYSIGEYQAVTAGIGFGIGK